MVVVLKLKHVGELKDGRKRFRKAWPTDVRDKFENIALSDYTRKTGAALVQWQEHLLREWEQRVAVARGETNLSPREQFEADLIEARRLASQVVGLGSDDERREVLAEELARQKARPDLIAIVSSSDPKPPPAYTLEDARAFYIKEKLGGDRQALVRFNRICGRLSDVLGPLKAFPLVDLRKTHGYQVRDAMLGAVSNKGKPLAPSSVTHCS